MLIFGSGSGLLIVGYFPILVWLKTGGQSTDFVHYSKMKIYMYTNLFEMMMINGGLSYVF